MALVSVTPRRPSDPSCVIVSHSGGREIPGCGPQSQEEGRGAVSAPFLQGGLWSFCDIPLLYCESSAELRARSACGHLACQSSWCLASDECFVLQTLQYQCCDSCYGENSAITRCRPEQTCWRRNTACMFCPTWAVSKLLTPLANSVCSVISVSRS